MIVYKVTNLITNDVYIGKTAYELKMRKACHLSYSKRGSNTYFHRAIRKYGIENFEWSILSEIDNELKLNAMEKFYIMIYRKMTNIYNLTEGGDGQLGRSPSEETKKKFSEMYKGKIISEETKNKISKGNKGKKRSEEFKKNLSEMKRGLKYSEETKKLQSEQRKGNNYALGNILSEETRKKMSESKKGNQNARKFKVNG